MKREFLEGLELEKETVDAIMKEHGKTVQATNTDLEEAKTTVETLQEQLEERKNDIKELQEQSGSSDELQSELQDLQQKYDNETQELQDRLANQRKQSAIQLGVTKAGAKNEKAVMALLDADSIQINDDGVHGLKEQIEKLQETDDYLFDTGEQPSGQTVKGGNPNRGKPPKEDNVFLDAVNKMTGK